MKVVEDSYKSKDGKDYYYAVGFKVLKTIEIYKNFSCAAEVMKASGSDKVWFLGDSINLDRIPKKYKTWQI